MSELTEAAERLRVVSSGCSWADCETIYRAHGKLGRHGALSVAIDRDRKTLADAYLAITASLTPEVLEAAERLRILEEDGWEAFKLAFRAAKKSGPAYQRIIDDRATIANFALPIIAKLREKA